MTAFHIEELRRKEWLCFLVRPPREEAAQEMRYQRNTQASEESATT
jgi:hypothetical protein